VLTRKDVVTNEIDAAKLIKDGMTIGIGGMLASSHPMALIRQIIRNRVKKLTVVGSPLSGLEIDLLIGAGCVDKIITPYVGGESLAPIGPFYRWAAEHGIITIIEFDEGMYFAGLKAAGQMLPFAPWRGGVGTDFPKVNPSIKIFTDPIKGETLLAIPAIKLDIFLTHAAFSDKYGHIQHIGTGFDDKALSRAAELTVVQVEKLVTNEEIRKDPAKTSIPFADAVVHVPFGAHPSASPGFYLHDVKHMQEYLKSANAFVKHGDNKPFDEYLKKYVFEPANHQEYLERIGIGQLYPLFESF
jgi:glutaconate CoA-transferase subunit A